MVVGKLLSRHVNYEIVHVIIRGMCIGISKSIESELWEVILLSNVNSIYYVIFDSLYDEIF